MGHKSIGQKSIDQKLIDKLCQMLQDMLGYYMGRVELGLARGVDWVRLGCELGYAGMQIRLS